MRQFSELRLLAGSGLVAFALFFLTGCNAQMTDVLGTAYIAPATVNLRREVADKTGSVAVLKHAEEVYILEVRRRFVRIRSQHGAVGWVDSTQLLPPDEMNRIRKQTQYALSLPSEGAAGVYEALNVHIDPSRQSPAFVQVQENGSVEVLAHKLQPKLSTPPKPPVFELRSVNHPAPARKSTKGKKGRETLHLPPPPPPPKAPVNWLALSPSPAPKNTQDKKPDAPQKPVPTEDWTLIRTKDKQCGWVLSRNLVMSIPDDVAQYAEGKRITSYFDLGVVNDEEKGPRHNWLWTTSSDVETYDFDAWRVFLWNRHRHRYETSYRQRDLEGYFPVHVDSPEGQTAERTFELTTKDDDGKMRRRTYVFDGTRVRLRGQEDVNTTPMPSPTPTSAPAQQIQMLRRPNWIVRQWNALTQRFSKKKT